MPQYLYRIIPVRPEMVKESTPDEQRIVGEHFAYLKDLTEKGVMLLVGRTTNTDYSTFGICVYLAEDDAAAQSIMENDPAVRQRVMRGEVYPYRVALLHPGWELPE